MKRRFLIYSFYDKDGIVEDFVTYFLKSVKPFCERIITVVNGDLTEDSKKKLEQYSERVILRENVGFDSSAYKDVISQIGYEKLREYDELILANSTMYGPVLPLQPLFDEMEKRDCDFWGITKHPSIEHYFAGVKIDEHVQSYFLVYNNKLLQTKDFEEFWDTLQTATNYEEAVAFFELRTTKFFKDRGYKPDSFIDLEKYRKEMSERAYFYPIIQQIKEDGMPFVKRKIFQIENNYFINYIKGGVSELIKYLEKNTDYNVKWIIEDIKRTEFPKIKTVKVFRKYIKSLFIRYIIFWKYKHYVDKAHKLYPVVKMIIKGNL